MKSIRLSILIILLLPFAASAEYNGHQIEFRIEMSDGESFIGYNYLSDLGHADSSLTYEEFLEKNYELILRNQFNDMVGEWTCYKHRIKYDYLDYDGTKSSIHVLIDKRSINKLEIQSFEIIELIDQSYLIGVSSIHKWEDRIWMSKAPVEQFSTGGYLCDHQVFIHENDPTIEQMKKELERVQAEFEKEINEQQQIMEFSDGDPYYEAENRIEELENELDDNIADVIFGYDGLKIVIISMCTC